MTTSTQLTWQGWHEASRSYRMTFLCPDPSRIGQKAQLVLLHSATPLKVPEYDRTHTAFGVKMVKYTTENETKVVYQQPFVITGSEQTLSIPESEFRGYTYRGESLKLECLVQVRVHHSILKGLAVQNQRDLKLKPKTNYLITNPALEDQAKQDFISPKDRRNLIKNFWALDGSKKFQIIAVGVLYTASLYGAGWWIYDNFTEDGFPFSEFVIVGLLFYLFGATVIIPKLWTWATQSVMTHYATLKTSPISELLSRQSHLKVSDLFQGMSHIDLKNITLNVLALEFERYVYTIERPEPEEANKLLDHETLGHLEVIRKSTKGGIEYIRVQHGDTARVRTLYSKTVDLLPKNHPIESFFHEDLALDELFNALHPPFKYSDTTGVEIQLQVQLISPDLMDIKKTIEHLKFKDEDFYQVPNL